MTIPKNYLSVPLHADDISASSGPGLFRLACIRCSRSYQHATTKRHHVFQNPNPAIIPLSYFDPPPVVVNLFVLNIGRVAFSISLVVFQIANCSLYLQNKPDCYIALLVCLIKIW
jgi:hypothetical protein